VQAFKSSLARVALDHEPFSLLSAVDPGSSSALKLASINDANVAEPMGTSRM
jgi:hypothetical protein